MAAFEYRQALEVRDTFQRHGVRYLFIGKSGAILLGYPDTTQDADLFLDNANLPQCTASNFLAFKSSAACTTSSGIM